MKPILMQTDMVRATLEDRKTQTRRITGKALKHMNERPDQWRSYSGEDGKIKSAGIQKWGFSNIVTGEMVNFSCPYSSEDMMLWVRETFSKIYDYCDHPEMPGAGTEYWDIGFKYKADNFKSCSAECDFKNGCKDDEECGFVTGWKPSIHMPREACRLFLRIKDIRVERVQNISESDCLAEGIRREYLPPDPDNFHPPGSYGYVHSNDEKEMIEREPVGAFKKLWDSINASRGFPWDSNPWVWVVEFEREK